VKQFTFSRLLFVLALLVSVAGCRSARNLADLPDSRPALFPNHTLGQIRYQLAVVPDTIEALQTRANVQVVSPDVRGSFTLRINQRVADTLMMTVNKVGIRWATVLVTPDSFFVYDRVKKDLYYNSTDVAVDLAGMPVTLADATANLLGTLEIPLTRGWEVHADTANYYVSNRSTREFYSVDPRIWRVTQYIKRSLDGEIVERRSFSNFDLFGQAYLPRRVIFSRPLDEQHLSLYHRSMEINPEELDLEFRISDSPNRILFP